jgi:hypothetical protein
MYLMRQEGQEFGDADHRINEQISDQVILTLLIRNMMD